MLGSVIAECIVVQWTAAVSVIHLRTKTLLISAWKLFYRHPHSKQPTFCSKNIWTPSLRWDWILDLYGKQRQPRTCIILPPSLELQTKDREDFAIMENASTRVLFSWFKTLLRYYSKQVLAHSKKTWYWDANAREGCAVVGAFSLKSSWFISFR